MCIFCKILNGEIPCSKIYENDYVVAFLDISQVTKGHTLIVPKRHVENVFSLTKEECANIMEACVYVANKLKEKLGVENVNLLNNSGVLAGQSVMHFHMHVIPRYGNDDITIKQVEHEPNFDELSALCKLLNE